MLVICLVIQLFRVGFKPCTERRVILATPINNMGLESYFLWQNYTKPRHLVVANNLSQTLNFLSCHYLCWSPALYSSLGKWVLWPRFLHGVRWGTAVYMAILSTLSLICSMMFIFGLFHLLPISPYTKFFAVLHHTHVSSVKRGKQNQLIRFSG